MSQKLIICLNQLNAVNRPFCCSLRRGRVYTIGPYCMGKLNAAYKTEPPVGECCPSIGVTPCATPAEQWVDTIDRQPGSGRPRSVCVNEKTENVEDLVLSQEDNP